MQTGSLWLTERTPDQSSAFAQTRSTAPRPARSRSRSVLHVLIQAFPQIARFDW